jgi:hypothetical protein
MTLCRGIRGEYETVATRNRSNYNKWWKGKKVRIHQSKIITVRQVTYYGNSVYGGASLIDENNDNFPIFTRSYRPRKKRCRGY